METVSFWFSLTHNSATGHPRYIPPRTSSPSIGMKCKRSRQRSTTIPKVCFSLITKFAYIPRQMFSFRGSGLWEMSARLYSTAQLPQPHSFKSFGYGDTASRVYAVYTTTLNLGVLMKQSASTRRSKTLMLYGYLYKKSFFVMVPSGLLREH